MDTGTRTDPYPAPPEAPLPTLGRPTEDANGALWPLNYFASPAGPEMALRPGVAAAVYTLAANRGHGWAAFVTPGTEGTDTFAGYDAAFAAGCIREVECLRGPGSEDAGDAGPVNVNGWRLGPYPVTFHHVSGEATAGYHHHREGCAAFGIDMPVGQRPPPGDYGAIGWAVARDGASLAVVAFMPPEMAPGTPLGITGRADNGTELPPHTLGVPVAVAVVTGNGEVESLEVRPGLTPVVLDAWLDTVAEAWASARHPAAVVRRAALEAAHYTALCAADAVNTDTDVETPERDRARRAEDSANAAWDTSVAGAKPYRSDLVLRLVQPATITHAYTGRVDRDGASVALRIGVVTRNGGVVRVHLDALPVGNVIVLR